MAADSPLLHPSGCNRTQVSSWPLSRFQEQFGTLGFRGPRNLALSHAGMKNQQKVPAH